MYQKLFWPLLKFIYSEKATKFWKKSPVTKKEGPKNFLAAPFLVSFSQLPAAKKGHRKRCSWKFFGPSYFVTALTFEKKTNSIIAENLISDLSYSITCVNLKIVNWNSINFVVTLCRYYMNFSIRSNASRWQICFIVLVEHLLINRLIMAFRDYNSSDKAKNYKPFQWTREIKKIILLS